MAAAAFGAPASRLCRATAAAATCRRAATLPPLPPSLRPPPPLRPSPLRRRPVTALVPRLLPTTMAVAGRPRRDAASRAAAATAAAAAAEVGGGGAGGAARGRSPPPPPPAAPPPPQALRPSVPLTPWRVLRIPDGHLRLDVTLANGQAFRWVRTAGGGVPWAPPPAAAAEAAAAAAAASVTATAVTDGAPAASAAAKEPTLYDEWAGPVGPRLFLLRQAALSATSPRRAAGRDEPVYYTVLGVTAAEAARANASGCGGGGNCGGSDGDDGGGAVDEAAAATALADYFHASVDVAALMTGFAAADDHFRDVSPALLGARMLRQDPTECLFAFLCSQNNHLSRIAGMVGHLAAAHGERLGVWAGVPHAAFPTVEALAARATEEDLREAAFGYRARYVVGCANDIAAAGGAAYLAALRPAGREAVAAALTALPGVGRKVAGCVSLFSLDQADEVPVDTHVWRLAVRDYLPHLGEGKGTLTPRAYAEVGDFFRGRFGGWAGWAHSVLFVAELPAFAPFVPKGRWRGGAAAKAVAAGGAAKGGGPKKGSSPKTAAARKAPAAKAAAARKAPAAKAAAARKGRAASPDARPHPVDAADGATSAAATRAAVFGSDSEGDDVSGRAAAVGAAAVAAAAAGPPRGALASASPVVAGGPAKAMPAVVAAAATATARRGRKAKAPADGDVAPSPTSIAHMRRRKRRAPLPAAPQMGKGDETQP